jgi:hypothetical protein
VPWLVVEPPAHVSVYQLVRARRVVFEREALRALEEALSSSEEGSAAGSSAGEGRVRAAAGEGAEVTA